jgi:cyclase
MPPRTAAFPKQLHDLGAGNFAYTQHDGSWGWSNSGLIVDGPDALVVDTLFDLDLTREMLDAYERVLGPRASIGTLVNSHANGDHTFGNELLGGARIVASRRCAEEMVAVPPELLANLMRAAPQLGVTGEYLQRIFGTFTFDGIALTPPTETFDGELELRVGGKEVRLIEVGPAHTRGDTIVWVPDERIVYTADVLFIGGHPIMWEGPLANWLRALDLILTLDVEAIVPGHGPVLTDKAPVRALKDYFEELDREARRRYDAGMAAADAARDIVLGVAAGWSEGERIVANVGTLYREYAGADEPTPAPEVFGAMAEFDRVSNVTQD